MTLSIEQQRKVEKNLGLVGKVIKDRVHGSDRCGIFSYDDLFQIGCIGLCKAAATDKGGRFSTYAYRLIWNEICDALIYANRRSGTELLIDGDEWQGVACDQGSRENAAAGEAYCSHESHMELLDLIDRARAEASPTVRKGIEALELMLQGYSSREIGMRMDAAPNLVTAWVAKARKYLRALPELQEIKLSGGSL